jgi:16S rRNA (cytidine1402-2'-O)-methyltransferase
VSGTLFVVATPIGNLSDLTERAIRVLRECDRVVAEDTRRSRTLLAHLGLSGKRVDRLDANASEGAVAHVAAAIANGEKVALVTDAGTPSVSDPGGALVVAVRALGGSVIPIPGASAVMAAVSVAGLVKTAFRFLGFLPRSGVARRDVLEIARDTPECVVLFESPERVAETLANLAEAMPDRAVFVGREMTKLHEEHVTGTLADVARDAPSREWLGEITIVLGEAVARATPVIDDAEIDRRIDEALAAGRRAKDVAEELALTTGAPKRELYARVVARKSLPSPR